MSADGRQARRHQCEQQREKQRAERFEENVEPPAGENSNEHHGRPDGK